MSSENSIAILLYFFGLKRDHTAYQHPYICSNNLSGDFSIQLDFPKGVGVDILDLITLLAGIKILSVSELSSFILSVDILGADTFNKILFIIFLIFDYTFISFVVIKSTS